MPARRGRSAFDLDRLSRELADTRPAVVERAVSALARRLSRLRDVEYRQAVEAVCSLFYVDTADRPDLERALERATALLAGQKARVVPILISQMQGSDLKSHLHLARALGRIGKPALPALRDLLATSEDAYSRAFALYAIGKMTCPETARALPEILGGLMHPDKEVRDSAARTLGKIAETVPRVRLSAERRREMFEGLLRAARDAQAPVRAKAFRSLGKMAAARLLDRARTRELVGLAREALGEADEYAWDHAYIVRREAREALEATGEGA